MEEKLALPSVAGTILFPQRNYVETCPEPMFEHQSKICLILPLQNNTLHGETTEFPSEGRTFPFSFPGNFPLGAGEIEKEETNSLFSASVRVYTPALKERRAHGVSHLAFQSAAEGQALTQSLTLQLAGLGVLPPQQGQLIKEPQRQVQSVLLLQF